MTYFADLMVDVILYVIYGALVIAIYKWNLRRRMLKREILFLKVVRIKYPEGHITYSALSSSDEESLRKLERKLCGFTE